MAAKSNGPLVVGVDLGGTKILSGVVDRNNRILGRAKRATPAKEGGPAILKTIVDCVDEAIESAGLKREDVAAAGIGSPGPLDVNTGVILFSANMNVKNYPLAPELSKILNRPTILRNDVRVGGYAEYRLGAGQGFRSMISAFVGTGIGGCVVLNGEIVEGSTGNAGELGHMVVRAGGPKCGCGARGCMEALASKTAIAKRIEKSGRKGRPSPLAEKIARKGRLKSGDLEQALADKDPVAIDEVKRAARYLGLGLGSLVNVLGPEVVIVGGGVAEALGDSYVSLVRDTARTQILTDPENKIQIVRAALGDNAGLLGAALMAREQLLKA